MQRIWLVPAALFAATAFAQAPKAGAAPSNPLPPIAPDKAGFSAAGLARIDAFFEREIAQNRVPGAVVAIARDGKLVYYKATASSTRPRARRCRRTRSSSSPR